MLRDMNIKRFEFNYFGENTYIIWDATSKEAAIIDPGMINPDEVDEVEAFLSAAALQLKYILLTHVHIDHTFGIDALKEKYDIKVLAHKGDAALGQTRNQQAKMFHLPIELGPVDIDSYLDDGSTLSLGNEQIKVLHTPGHSMGGVCYYVPESGFVVTGDTLFRGSIGRTDLPGGNQRQLILAIRSKLLTLPPDTKVFPGHGPSTTIADEAHSNPFL